MLRKILPAVFIILAFTATAQIQTSKMNAFVTDLLKKMTLDEKIGQLNLLTDGGGVPTGSVVNTNVEAKIKEGKVGGLFGVTGVEKIRRAQEIAIKKGESRELSFTINEEELKFYNSDLKRIVEPGEFHIFIGTSSSNAKKATFSLQ